MAAFHVERPERITHRDSAGHPFPAREPIGMNSGPSRCWSVRGSSALRGDTGHAALMQVFNPVRQSTVDAIGRTGLRINRASHPGGFAHLQLPLSPSFSGKVSTSSRCHIAASHFDASTTPRDSIPRHHERSRHDHQHMCDVTHTFAPGSSTPPSTRSWPLAKLSETRDHGPRDQQEPNRPTPPARSLRRPAPRQPAQRCRGQ